MLNINIKRIWYHIKYRYPTREIAMVVGIICMIMWFIWGSVQAMQKNYELRHMVDSKRREVALVELEMKMLEYEQRYLQSEEFKKLSVRQRLGHGDPGEKVLVLPANTPQASEDDTPEKTTQHISQKPSNISQWMNFLFGGNVQE